MNSVRSLKALVIPANAGIQFLACDVESRWIPACAGMTKGNAGIHSA